jgi:putative NADH-flavin reductase
MPVLVVGADTAPGRRIIEALVEPDREVRAFVTDVEAAPDLRARGVKVAIGDVSDDSHVAAAATNCFSAVLIAEAASDDRERAFAATPEDVLRGWAGAVTSSGVTRAIWVYEGEPPQIGVPEVATIDPADPGLAERVAALDDAQVMGKLSFGSL